MPKHVMVARSLGCVGWNGEVPLQIMNVGPGPIKLFKGTRVGYFTPIGQILVIEKPAKELVEQSTPQFPLSGSQSPLSAGQKTELMN